MACVFKRKRRVGGKIVLSQQYYGEYMSPVKHRLERVCLGVRDKQVAKELLTEMVREEEREAAGIIVPRGLRDAAQKNLNAHLKDYLADIVAKGRDEKYIYILDRRLNYLLADCGWKLLRDVTADSFVAWRTRQSGRAAKTLNEYLDAARSWMTWMMRQGRIPLNPLVAVGKVEARGKQVRQRRAYTDDEIRALLDVAGPRKVIYMLAVHTGLRRAEIAALRKRDVVLDGSASFVRARAATTKNHKEAIIRLHPELVEHLAEMVGQNNPAEELLFAEMPKMSQVRADLEAAGIAYRDEDGRVADFHALRHTLCTNLARAGVPQRVAMEIMRHSDSRLTERTYTDAGKLPVPEAIAALPRFLPVAEKSGTVQRTVNSGGEGHSESRTGTVARTPETEEITDNQGERHGTSCSGAEGRENEDGSRGRARVYQLSIILGFRGAI